MMAAVAIDNNGILNRRFSNGAPEMGIKSVSSNTVVAVVNDESSSDCINDGIKSLIINNSSTTTTTTYGKSSNGFGKIKGGSMSGSYSKRAIKEEKSITSSPYQEYLETRRSGPSREEKDSLYSTTDDDGTKKSKKTVPLPSPENINNNTSQPTLHPPHKDSINTSDDDEYYDEEVTIIDSQLMPSPPPVLIIVEYFCYMMVTFQHKEKINTYIGKSRNPIDKVKQHNHKKGRKSKHNNVNHNDISSNEASDSDDDNNTTTTTTKHINNSMPQIHKEDIIQQNGNNITAAATTTTDKWQLEMIIGPVENKNKAIDFKNLWRQKSRGIQSRRTRGKTLASSNKKTTWDCRIEST